MVCIQLQTTDSDDDVVIEDPPLNKAAMDEAPQAKRRELNRLGDGETTDHSSGTGVGAVGQEVLFVGEHVDEARLKKGKFPASQTAADPNVKPEGQPSQYEFSEEDLMGLMGLDEEELAEYAAVANASSSRNAEYRAARQAAYRRFVAEQAQLDQELQHSQLQLQHSTADDATREDEVITISDSDPDSENQEHELPSLIHGYHRHEQAAAGDAAMPAPDEGPLPGLAATIEAEAEPAAQHQQRKRPGQQEQIVAEQPAPRQHQQRSRQQQRQQQQQQQRRPPRPQQQPRQQQQQQQEHPQQHHSQQQQQQHISEDVLKRRRLRQHITNEMERLHREQDQLTNAGSNRLLNMLEHATDIAEKIEQPREAAKHSEWFAQLCEKGVQVMRNAESKSSGRRPIDLVNALVHAYRSTEYDDGGPVSLNWKRLGAVVVDAGLWRSAPGVDNMLGPLHAATKVRRVAQRRPKEQVASQVKPLENPLEESGAAQETDHWMQEMREVLAAHPGGRVSLVQLVVNHNSFSQTVENIFALSFLVKDMWVRVEEDHELGLQIINVTKQERAALKRQDNPPAGGGSSNGGGATHAKQFMMQIDMDMWRGMCQVVPRGRGLMPHRASSTQQQQQDRRNQQQQR